MQSPRPFRNLFSLEEGDKVQNVYGIDIYHIFIYLNMELLWLVFLLRNSTLNKESHHYYYSELLKKILAVNPSQILVLKHLKLSPWPCPHKSLTRGQR